jgi:hypothetical protein
MFQIKIFVIRFDSAYVGNHFTLYKLCKRIDILELFRLLKVTSWLPKGTLYSSAIGHHAIRISIFFFIFLVLRLG